MKTFSTPATTAPIEISRKILGLLWLLALLLPFHASAQFIQPGLAQSVQPGDFKYDDGVICHRSLQSAPLVVTSKCTTLGLFLP